MESYNERILNVVAYLKRRISSSPKIGVILGSGLSKIAEEIEEKIVIGYKEIQGFPSATIKGHKGEVIFGFLEGKAIVLFNGRFHYYQGYLLQDVVMPVRVCRRLGVETIIITNASGGINRSFNPGDIMLISDHINLMANNPLIGKGMDETGSIFVDMSEPYDLDLIKKIKGHASKVPGIGKLREGVYLAVSGPSYETRAEIAFFEKIGADAVGMSTVPEVIVAKQSGMRVLGISVIANMACGIKHGKLSHNEVLENVDRASSRLIILIKEIIRDVL